MTTFWMIYAVATLFNFIAWPLIYVWSARQEPNEDWSVSLSQAFWCTVVVLFPVLNLVALAAAVLVTIFHIAPNITLCDYKKQ